MLNNFRYDINFLRMLAVMAVVINHISPVKLAGGYLGVDIFFVISAYLISSLLLKEYAKSGTVNLVAFYRRRIFRIAPALSVVLVFTLVASGLLFYYDKLAQVNLSSIFSNLGFANVYFWKFLKLDYFNPTADTEPLLHLWSLGVEEQFYFLFPLSMLLLWRFKKLFVYLLILTFVVSIALATVLDNYDFVYYNLPTRVFELIAGVLASIYGHSKKKNNEESNEQQNLIISLLSLAIIAFSLFYLGEKYRLPNYYSLMVVFPTVVLLTIDSQKQSKWIAKFYKFKLFQLLGLWSYSIYLWHWVLLAFAKIIFGLDLPPYINYIILFSSPLLGALSYYHVEQKTRYLKWSFKKGLLIFILLPLSFNTSCYYYAKVMDKKMEAYKPKLSWNGHGSYGDYKGRAFVNKPKFKQDIYEKLVPINSLAKKSNIILVGDSYGTHNIAFMKTLTNYLKVSFDTRTISGGGPLLLKDSNVSIDDTENSRHYQLKFANTDLLKYDVIILANRYYTELNIDDLYQTVEKLNKLGKTVILLPEIPVLTTLELSSIIKPFTIVNNNKFNEQHYQNFALLHNKKLEGIAEAYPNTYYLDYNKFLFNDNGQLTYKDGRNSLYFNIDHLSVYGATWLANKYIASGIDKYWDNIVKDYHAQYGKE